VTLFEVAKRRRDAVVAGHTGDETHARVALTDEHRDVRAAALAALGRLGVLAGSDLERSLGDCEPSVRRRACELAASEPTVDLIPSLSDSNPSVVEAAAWACGERPPRPKVVAALSIVALQHEDPLSREAAVAALGAIGDRSGLETILAALGDKAPVRRRAVLALAPFEGTAVTEALEAALGDRDWQVRQAAQDLLPHPPT